MANALLANAPIRDINKSSFGIATAKPATKEMNLPIRLISIAELRTCYYDKYGTECNEF